MLVSFLKFTMLLSQTHYSGYSSILYVVTIIKILYFYIYTYIRVYTIILTHKCTFETVEISVHTN